MHPRSVREARDLKSLFMGNANSKLAGPMKRYMRDQFDYLGIKSPRLAELLREHYQQHGLPPLSDLDRIVRDLWALRQREFQYAATSLLAKFETQLPSGFIRTLHYLLVTKSWWDTVDTISTGTLGVHFKRYPKVKERTLAQWRKSRNFWLRRACILFQLNYKQDTDFALLCDIIRENLQASGHSGEAASSRHHLYRSHKGQVQAHVVEDPELPERRAHPDPTRDRGGSKEFFINKAIGWALRQYTRIDPQAVRQFVAETPLQPLSAREALKWLERRGL